MKLGRGMGVSANSDDSWEFCKEKQTIVVGQDILRDELLRYVLFDDGNMTYSYSFSLLGLCRILLILLAFCV